MCQAGECGQAAVRLQEQGREAQQNYFLYFRAFSKDSYFPRQEVAKQAGEPHSQGSFEFG